jgi:hypothetical protein
MPAKQVESVTHKTVMIKFFDDVEGEVKEEEDGEASE